MSEEPKAPRDYGLHPGDLGVIAIAMLCTFGFLFLMFDPAPLKGLDKFEEVADKARQQEIAKAEKAQRLQQIKAAEASGVVMVGILPAKH
jgi:hypothetical protein